MKNLFTVLFVLVTTILPGQELTKKEFNQIFIKTGRIRELILNGDGAQIGELLQINGFENFEEFKSIITNQKISFNSKSEHTYAHPYFYLTDKDNIIELTIPAMKILNKRDNEDYERGRYYFVLRTDIEYCWNDNTVYFVNPKLLTDNKEIEKWWLGIWKNYVPEIVKVSDKFGFKGPPPPCPPENLK